MCSQINKEDPCLNCAFPDLPAKSQRTCSRLGPATGIAGVMGANEVLKILLGKGELARGYLMSCSNFQNDYYRLPISKDPHCPSCGAGK